MRVSGERSEDVDGGMGAHDGDAGRERDRADLGRYVSPRLRQVLAAAETATRDGFLRAGSKQLGGERPERLEKTLSELLEDLPGSFYPVYNSERGRWELGIR